MQTEEVVHTSRLYSILLTERTSDSEEQALHQDLFPHWSKDALISEIKQVKRTLSRKLSTIRRGRLRTDPRHDICSDKSAIKPVTSQPATKFPVISSSGPGKPREARSRSSQASTETDGRTQCGPNLSRIFGSFRRSLRHEREEAGPGSKLTEHQEEITSGRDSAYFSLNQTSSESEAGDSSKVGGDDTLDSIQLSLAPSIITSSLLRTKQERTPAEPKKNVTLLLPKNKTKQKPFGLHLQTEVVSIHPTKHQFRLSPDGDVFWQLDSILQVSKVHLVSNFPRFDVSIEIIFAQPPQAVLMSLSSDVIGDLMFHLNRILFSPHLKTIVTWEVTLFLIIKFLYKLVAMINSNRLCTITLSLSSVKNYHKCFLKDFCTFETAEILTQIQREFIQIWMCLLQL